MDKNQNFSLQIVFIKKNGPVFNRIFLNGKNGKGGKGDTTLPPFSVTAVFEPSPEQVKLFCLRISGSVMLL